MPHPWVDGEDRCQKASGEGSHCTAQPEGDRVYPFRVYPYERCRVPILRRGPKTKTEFGFFDESPEPQHHTRRNDENDSPLVGHPDTKKIEGPIQEVGNVLESLPPYSQGKILKKNGNPHRGHKGTDFPSGFVQQGMDDRLFNQHPQEIDDCYGEEKAQDGRNTKGSDTEIQNVSPNHVELAMREVEHLHGAPDEGQTTCHSSIHTP